MLYFPRVGFVGPKRRGPVPNPGPRRALLFATSATRGLLERHRSLPNGALAFEEVPSRTPIRVSPVELNVRVLRPWVQQARDLDPAGPMDPAAAAERFLRERHLDLRFNPTSRRPISGRSHHVASTPHLTRKQAPQ